MKEWLIGQGWKAYHECHCGGVHRIEFDNGEYPGVMVKVYPKRGKFRASRAGRKIGEGTKETLETFINELVK